MLYYKKYTINASIISFIIKKLLLDFVLNRFMMKLFKTANIVVVDCCRVNYSLNVPSVLWSKRVREFDSKFASVDNYLCKWYV